MLDFNDQSVLGKNCDFGETELLDPYFDTERVHEYSTTTKQHPTFASAAEFDDDEENENEVVLDSEDESATKTKIFKPLVDDSFVGETDRRLLSGTAGVDGSDEPGEASQAYALDFVEQLVLRNSKELPVESDAGKVVKERVPPSASAKGIRSVAEFAGWRRSIEKMEVFEWVDDPCPVLEGKEGIEVSQRSVEKHFDHGDATTTGNELKDETLIINCPKKSLLAIDLNTVYEGDEGESSREATHNIEVSNLKFLDSVVELSDQHADGEDLASLSNSVGVGRESDEMLDVGLCTQMAAEAMEALSHACILSNVEDSSSCDTPCLKSRDGMGESEDRVCPSKRRGGTNKSSVEGHKKQKPEYELATPEKAKRDVLFRHYTRKKRSMYQISGGKSCKQDYEKPIGPFGLNYPQESNAFAEASVSNDLKMCRLRQLLGELNKYDATPGAGQPSSGPKPRSNEDLVHYVRRRKMTIPFEQGTSINNCKVPSNPSEGTRNQISSPEGLTGVKARHHCSMQMVLKIWSYPKGKRTPRTSAKNLTSCDPLHTSLGWTGLKNKKAYRKSDVSFDNSCFDIDRKEEQHSSHNCPPELPSSRTDCARNLLTPDKTCGPSPLKDISNQESAMKMPRVDSVNPKLFKQSCQGVPCNLTIPVHGMEESLSCIPSVKKVVSSGSRPSISSLAKNVNTVSTQVLHGHHQKRLRSNTPQKSITLKELGQLGICNSVPDFKWKDLRKRRHTAYVRVLFSQHLDYTIIRQQKKIMARLGIPIASSSQEATHFVADKFARTRNMLEAIGLGKPVVTHLWIESCGQAGCLVDEKNFILRDAKKEKEFGFNMSTSLARASQHGLLEGRKVFVTSNIKPSEEMITSLVKALRGEAISRSRIAAEMDQRNPDDILILSCVEDRTICVPFLERGAAVYSSELLLNGVLSQKLDYSRHQLFTSHPNRN